MPHFRNEAHTNLDMAKRNLNRTTKFNRNLAT